MTHDPIGLAGGNPTLYGYVGDTNWWIDPFGLNCQENSVSDERREHILEGDGPGTGTGHGPNRENTRGSFPDTWTDDQAINAIESVANSPDSTWRQSTGAGGNQPTTPITIGGPNPSAPTLNNQGNPVRFEVQGQNHGLDITVIVEPSVGNIITGYVRGR